MRPTTKSTRRRSATAVKPVRTEADHRAALRAIERLWGAPEGSAEGDRLDVLIALVELYEREHFSIDLPDPIEAIRFRLEQLGLDLRALVGVIGGRSRVYEVLRGDRQLSLSMIRQLHARFGIPAQVLIQPTRKRRSAA